MADDEGAWVLYEAISSSGTVKMRWVSDNWTKVGGEEQKIDTRTGDCSELASN